MIDDIITLFLEHPVTMGVLSSTLAFIVFIGIRLWRKS